MMKKTLVGRLMASVLVLSVCGTLSVTGARQAQAQGMRLGSAVARASHSEVDLNGKSILLTGGVTIETADGQTISSDTMRITMGTNPITKKDDVATAVAEGSVRFKTSQKISGAGATAQIRTVQGSSDKASWQRFDARAVLTGNVTVSSDEPVRKMIWRNAGSATIDLKAGKIVADKAAGGPQMTIESISKVVPAPKKTAK